MEIVIGFDPSSVSTGYSIFQDKKLINYGVIQPTSKNIIERITFIKNEIINIIKEYKPTHIIAEDISITMNAKTAQALMGLSLIIEIIAFENNIEYSSIRPSSWRKILGLSNSPKIKRQDKKKEAMEYVKEIYNIDIKKDDISDAICIGTAYIKQKEKKE